VFRGDRKEGLKSECVGLGEFSQHISGFQSFNLQSLLGPGPDLILKKRFVLQFCSNTVISQEQNL